MTDFSKIQSGVITTFGQSNIQKTQLQYEADFKNFLDRIRIDFPEVWIKIENLNPKDNDGLAAIQRHLIAIKAELAFEPDHIIREDFSG